jgi:ribulose-phosphate 3-epimerase
MARTEIIPAILVNDFASLESDIELVKGFVKTVQIDVCDGRFTPQASWPYRKHDDNFEKIVNEENGLPGWEDLNFEIDLMADDPADKIENWVQAGATRIILHAECKGDLDKAIADLSERVEIGLALNESTPIETVAKYRERIQFVQLMGIDNIGFQHQSFDDKVIGRVREAALKYPGLPISVDGGVSLENAQALIDAGATRLVVGSAIFNAENPIDAVEKFRHL